ncbi:hypothetical protein GCM10022280_12600 [Sphingomonas swuensis]|uniref:Uncharacterized protein n=1 Tax=Sphingomonas swuensis TaxID=977800 RepID=A0ABP7SR60_9SPHN
MTLLYVLAVLIWGSTLVYSAPGAVSAFRHSARQGDPMRLGVAMVSATILLGSLRWLFAPQSESLLAVVFVLSCGTGCFVLRLMRTYGRGRHVR